MSEPWSQWPAPAKLNLFLHIVGRRADGYHVLQTVFQLLDWGDTIALRVRSDGKINRSEPVAGVPSETDLTLRAARALQAHCATSSGVEIRLHKRIPVGGGLGGGSSDAATVLVALNELWDLRLGTDELARIGQSLGADVPVFIRGQSAWAEGIGEHLTPIELPRRYFVIVDPGVCVATGPLFQAAELTRNSPPTTISDFLAGKTTNVFAPLVRARHPPVSAAMDWLKQFGEPRLTGSGGCVFIERESAAEVEAIVRACPAPFTAHGAAGVAQSALPKAVETWRAARTVTNGVPR